jgi:hypothetical protein
MSKDIGNAFGLYTAATEPTTPEDIAEYNLVGFATALSYSNSRNMIDASNKDSGADSEFESGRRTKEVSGTFYADVADGGNAGQEVIETAINDAVGDSVWWLITDNVTGNVQHYGEAKPSQFDLDYPDEGMVEIDTTLQVTGPATRAAVT